MINLINLAIKERAINYCTKKNTLGYFVSTRGLLFSKRISNILPLSGYSAWETARNPNRKGKMTVFNKDKCSSLITQWKYMSHQIYINSSMISLYSSIRCINTVQVQLKSLQVVLAVAPHLSLKTGHHWFLKIASHFQKIDCRNLRIKLANSSSHFH